MDKLREEYRKSLKMVEDAKRKANDNDRDLLNHMASDLRFTIEWMRVGHHPGHRRGIERRAAYQTEQPMDPLVMQSFVANQTSSNTGISEHQKEMIEEALSKLTNREKEVYLLVRGEAYSRSEAAKVLGVCKGTVNNIMKRCDQKIKIKKTTSFFNAPLAN
ncbi:sigma factor-like helix-turn-helix DNA-binding protein [Halalkalibacter sp. APA_J-10(15)]|uniref:sigma factor-like helix-turn-helix DNA-binding protein n=1 Tax=Halalkalibacter sp. APA_J-10(15) TaxID=2933805 RepID=UPI001FF33B76|nr:sigma factor-like helix-turn-helix DNA-binding protein [Halalkalibacter sp. APA_J-10(15)]MCK0471409.1 hypothetical protein [Halalkalibacter sp. APA_J-10(15)]